MSVLSTSTSQPFSAGLTGEVIPPAELSTRDRAQMYALLETYFSGTDRARFDADLCEKEAVIALREWGTGDAACPDRRDRLSPTGGGRIVGFSTFMRLTATIDGEEVVAFFSGDTIVAREYWGESILARTWGTTMIAEAERIGGRVYWFLICSGYKTWRFLPVFFRAFHPNPGSPTPPREQHVLDTLAAAKFGGEYRREEGVVRFERPTPLRPGVADVTEERLRDPRIAFFERINPGHIHGDELVCLTEISRANLTRAGLRMLG